MFRRIYWVVESHNGDHVYHLNGVFTSIHDLIERGMPAELAPTRLSLVKLDARDGVLGTWSGPSFEGLSQALQEYVGTGEFSIEQVRELSTTLHIG